MLWPSTYGKSGNSRRAAGRVARTDNQRYSPAPVSASDAITVLEETLSRLTTRIEKLEGTMHQLRVQAMHPSLYCPTRTEFQALEERVAAVEKSRSRGPLPPPLQS